MILFYFLLNLSMAGGNQDHLVGPILCFTLRDQSYISKVPDPQKVFNRTEWISVLAEPNPIRFGKSSKMNSSPTGHWPWPQPPPLRRPWPCRIRPLLGLARWSEVVSANLFCYAEINLFWMPVALEKDLRFLARHTKYCRTTLIFKQTQCTYSKVQFYMNVPVMW